MIRLVFENVILYYCLESYLFKNTKYIVLYCIIYIILISKNTFIIFLKKISPLPCKTRRIQKEHKYSKSFINMFFTPNIIYCICLMCSFCILFVFFFIFLCSFLLSFVFFFILLCSFCKFLFLFSIILYFLLNYILYIYMHIIFF